MTIFAVKATTVNGKSKTIDQGDNGEVASRRISVGGGGGGGKELRK